MLLFVPDVVDDGTTNWTLANGLVFAFVVVFVVALLGFTSTLDTPKEKGDLFASLSFFSGILEEKVAEPDVTILFFGCGASGAVLVLSMLVEASPVFEGCLLSDDAELNEKVFVVVLLGTTNWTFANGFALAFVAIVEDSMEAPSTFGTALVFDAFTEGWNNVDDDGCPAGTTADAANIDDLLSCFVASTDSGVFVLAAENALIGLPNIDIFELVLASTDDSEPDTMAAFVDVKGFEVVVAVKDEPPPKGLEDAGTVFF